MPNGTLSISGNATDGTSGCGEVVARDVCKRVGLSEPDVQLVADAVRHHLLLPVVATRRDLDDPMTVQHVATTVGSRTLLELLHVVCHQRQG